MALQTAYGNFTKSVGGAPASQAISGVGFEPKALIMWATLQTATGIAGESEFGLGFATGSGVHASGGASEDGQDISDVYSRHAVKALTLRDIAGTLVGECDLTSFDADGFTLSWTINDAVAYIIHYLAIGGSDVTDSDAGFFNTIATTGDQAVTGIGFQPDVVLFWGSATTFNPPFNFDNRNQYFGLAVSNTQRATGSISSRDAELTTQTFRRQLTDKCLAFHSSALGGNLGEADFVSMDVDGFTINWSVAPAGSVRVGYLAIRGGQYYVGSDLQRTTTGTEPTTGVGFLPTGLLMLSCNQIASATVDVHERFSVGAASGAGTEGCIWEGDTDALDISSTDMSTLTDKVIRLIDTDAPVAADAEADLDSFDADGFTLDWTTADAVAREFVFLAMGSSPVAAEPIAVQLTQNVIRVPDRMVLT